MGHKYSKIFTHNTSANYANHINTKPYKFPDLIQRMYKELYPYVFLSTKHFYAVKCKLCYQSLHEKPTVLLNCGSKHRYHPECIIQYYNKLVDISDDKTPGCDGCKNLFVMSIEQSHDHTIA